MSNYSIEGTSINKSFGRRLIFDNLNINLNAKDTLGIIGANGSGKTTLIKIIAKILSPSKGKVIHKLNGEEIIPEKLHNYIGFAAPYLVLYDEFSAWENLYYFANIRGLPYQKEKAETLLNKFKLYERKDDLVKTFSSGMKQRMKIIFALIHSPKVLLLDEPASNLDEEGKESVYEIIKEEAKKNIVIIASNENRDTLLCNSLIKLENYKS